MPYTHTHHAMPCHALTAEGFPRADVDVIRVRQLRNEVAIAQTDHMAIMQQIEALMFQPGHPAEATGSGIGDGGEAGAAPARRSEAVASSGPAASGAMPKSPAASPAPASPLAPFLAVVDVLPDSPAARAGIRAGDKVTQWGSITGVSAGPSPLTAVSAVAQHSRGAPVPVSVLRHGRTHSLTLVPTTWSGPGLTGLRLEAMPEPS